MQNTSPHKSKATELELLLDRWERRHEWRLLSKTIPRSLLIALLISLIVGAIGYFRFRLTAEQLALITAALCALGGILNIVYTLLFPRSLQTRACYFDLEFGLGERVSTAFELMHGRIKTHPEIESRQIADALSSARAIDPRSRIAMDYRPRELAALVVLTLAMLGMLLLPTIVGPDFVSDSPSPALEDAREDLREIIETIAKDSNLDDVDRQELLDSLEIALERLQEEDISEEEAFAAMSQLQSQLEDAENELGETLDLDQSSLEAAADALEDFIPPAETEDEFGDSASDTQPPPDNLQDLSQSVQQLGGQAQAMSPEEAAAAAEALQDAAEDLAQMNQDLSQDLESMADALEEGDAERLQEALDSALEQVSQTAGDQQRDQATQSMLQEQSERAEEAAESIARQQSEDGQEQSDDPRQGPPEESESGQQQSGQQGDQQSAQSQQRASQGNQPADRNRPGSGENRSQNQDGRASGSGAGQGEPSNQSLPGGAGEDQGAETNNQTSGTRQIAYEALYSPSGISGGGADEIRLESDASDNVLAEGNFDDNPLGESRVSYDTVFSSYQNAANRALESDYVPLGLRDVVREYFTSLEPNSG